MEIKPILYNTDMVRAILDNRKTVTRRVVKPQPQGAHDVLDCDYKAHTFDLICGNGGSGGMFLDWAETIKAPFWPGDILYVQETFTKYKTVNYIRRHDGRAFNEVSDGQYAYKADGYDSIEDLKDNIRLLSDCSLEAVEVWEDKWHPPIHMPREAARIFLRVKDVQVERLQDSFFEQGSTIVSLQDEGIDIGDHCRQCIENYGHPCCNDLNPELEFDTDTGEDKNGGSECGMLDEVRSDFANLWNCFYARPHPTKDKYGIIDHYESYPWEDIQETRTYRGKPWYAIGNPWIWAIEFERISREEAENGLQRAD